MKNSRKNRYALTIIVIVVANICLSCHQQPNVAFEQIDSKNWNIITNGTVGREYLISVKNFKDTSDIWEQIESEGKKNPYSGFTSVWFFNGPPFPSSVDNFELYFKHNQDHSYSKNCIGSYFHYSNGSEIFNKYPLATSEQPLNTTNFRNVLKMLKQKNIKYKTIIPGEQIEIGTKEFNSDWTVTKVISLITGDSLSVVGDNVDDNFGYKTTYIKITVLNLEDAYKRKYNITNMEPSAN